MGREPAPDETEVRRHQFALSTQDSFILNDDKFDSSTTRSLLLKKISERFYKDIKIEDIKIEDSFLIPIEPIKRKSLVKEYLNNFGNIITINGDHYFSQYKDCYILITLNHVTTILFLNVIIFSNSLENIYKTLDDFKTYITPILKNKDIAKLSITWCTKINGRTVEYYADEYLDDKFLPECYPYIDINDLVKNYINSEIPILFMLGPPGTGKTRLIREILKQMYLKIGIDNSINCIYTASRDIIEEGTIYLNLVFNSHDALVLEDIDYHVTPRTEGNTSMYNLLSISNGILSNIIKDKKIILSSNLPNVNNIDEALLRPGRCFSIVKTKKLTPEQANVVFKILGKEKIVDQKTYTLADIYNS